MKVGTVPAMLGSDICLCREVSWGLGVLLEREEEGEGIFPRAEE